jgi:hypothetical protein
MIESLLSCLLLLVLVVVAWYIVKVVLKLTGCIVYGVLTVIVAVGLLVILLLFVF